MKIVEKRRTEEPRKEVGVKESLGKKLARSRLKWAGRVERMGGERHGRGLEDEIE